MKVYFYHTQDLKYIYRSWNEGRFPGHFLYGATHLPRYGVDVVVHKHKTIQNRVRRSLYVAWRVLTCREHFDAIYATKFNGLEIIIFLRALHLYPKPIILWHHQPIVKADSTMREMVAQIFYRGIDRMFFFSERLIQESLKSSKAREERMLLGHWGADLEYYDHLMQDNPVSEHTGFISTGKEKRDMPTLIRAFSATGSPLNIYIAYNACGDNYLEILNDLRPSSNIHIQFINGLIPHELALKVWGAQFVAICCQETNYTVGLTTLVEALAMGLPVIATRNVTYPFDIEKEGVGIIVPYYDSVAWEKAIRYITTDTEAAERMGHRARRLAEEIYNLDNCTREVADVILSFEKKKQKEPEPQTAETPQPNAEPEPQPAVKPEPEVIVKSEPKVIVEPEPLPAVEPELFVEPEPVARPVVKPEPTVKPEPAVKPEPIVEPEPTVEPEFIKKQDAGKAQSPLDDAPIINVEALKHKLGILWSKVAPAVRNIGQYLPSKEQVMSYLPTKEELADLWEKTRQLSVRIYGKVKDMIVGVKGNK